MAAAQGRRPQEKPREKQNRYTGRVIGLRREQRPGTDPRLKDVPQRGGQQEEGQGAARREMDGGSGGRFARGRRSETQGIREMDENAMLEEDNES